MSYNSTYATMLTSLIGNISLYINFVTLIAGTIGCICNLITYTDPQLRHNSCVFYLLCATVFEIICILVVVPTRIAVDQFGNKLEFQSIIFCKIRYIFAIIGPKLVTYYTLFAILDRCLATSSNVQIRLWSQLKIAYRLSLILFITGIVTGIHVPIFYGIFNKNCQVPGDSVYTIFFAVYLIFFVSLLPHTLMFVFSLITFRNIKRTKQRIMPMAIETSTLRPKRSEYQLITLVVIQIILSSILVLLRLGSYTYSTITSKNLNKSENELAIENFAIKLGFTLYYFNFATSFYLSTLTRKYFRDIFKKRIYLIYRRCQQLIH